MIPTFSSDTEKNEFLTLSKTIQAGNYEEALAMSADMLERYPDNKHIYHNQIGAMRYLAKNDFWGATEHYRKALQYGFPADTCEENIWESAEDSFKYLIDSEAGFCSIMATDSGSIIARTYTLVEGYKEIFPNGQYSHKADELLFIYDLFTNGDYDNPESANVAYRSKFPEAVYPELVSELSGIYFK